MKATQSMRTFEICIYFIIFIQNSLAQNLIYTSGYSNVMQYYLLDVEGDEPILYDYGQQEDVDPNLTFIDIFSGQK